MTRLLAEVDTTRWVAVTDSLGFRGRRHRKRAIRMVMSQVTGAVDGPPRSGGKFAAWAVSQAVPMLMKKAAGRVLVWVWKDDPELLLVVASVQRATPQARVARAMRPIEHDDTEEFRHPTFGAGERLVLRDRSTTVQYSFDLQTQFIEVQALCGDDTRFGTVLEDLDALVREIRLVEDLPLGEANILQLPPA